MSRTFFAISLATALLAVQLASTPSANAQASEIPSAAPSVNPNLTPEQRGRALIDQMIAALGGDAWLNRTTIAARRPHRRLLPRPAQPRHHEYHEVRRLAASGQPEADRVGFLTERGMIMPGKKIDVVQIWTDGHGYEITYKGKTDLPKDQVEDFYRRRAHSIEEVVRTWINAPGVMIVAEGTTMVERRLADKVTVLSANNDAVTLELDATTHLPLRRTFEWRNQQFKDHDEDAEEYDDYHTIQGLPTAMTITRYHNGDMASQRFFTKVDLQRSPPAALFDPTIIPTKKK